MENNEMMTSSGGKRKSILPLIIILVLVTVVGIVGAVFFIRYNSPEQRLIRALDTGDYAKAQDILNEDHEVGENTDVVDNLKSRIETIRSEFVDGKSELSTVRSELQSIRNMNIDGIKSVLNEADDFIGRLNTSRANYAAAEELFNKKAYPEAIKKYSLVIEEDPNYESSKNRSNEAIGLYRKEYLDLAKAEADAKNYTGAINFLKVALQVLPEDSELTKQIAVYQNDMDTAELNRFIAEAKEKADEGSYELAIQVIESGLNRFPGSEVLNQKLKAYQEADANKKRDDLLASAEEQMKKGQYLNAISTLDNFIDEHPSDTEVKAVRMEYYGQYIDSIIDEANKSKESEDYVAALMVLNRAIATFPDESRLTALAEDIKDLDVQKIVEKAQKKLEAADYRGTIEILEDGLKQYKDEGKLSTMLSTTREKHIQVYLDSAQEAASKENYTEAVKIISEALNFYQADSRLKSKQEEYSAKLPVPLNDIRVINGGFEWNKGVPEDPFGNDYSTAVNYTINFYRYKSYRIDNEEYAEYRLYGNYKRIAGIIAPHTEMGEHGGGYIQIYADDKLVYTSNVLTRKTDAFSFDVDTRGVDYLKIIRFVGGNGEYDYGALILSDVLLYPN